MRHQLSNGKVPHLRVLVKTLIPSTRSATAVLMDPSGIVPPYTYMCIIVIIGDILATVHASVLEEYKTELVQGCAAILRQVKGCYSLSYAVIIYRYLSSAHHHGNII